MPSQENGAKTSFYRLGEARGKHSPPSRSQGARGLTPAGVGGDSEEWEHRVFDGGKSRLERLVDRPLNSIETRAYLDMFNYYKRDLQPGGSQCISFTAKNQAVQMGVADITNHFYAAHQTCFELFETGLEELCRFASGECERGRQAGHRVRRYGTAEDGSAEVDGTMHCTRLEGASLYRSV